MDNDPQTEPTSVKTAGQGPLRRVRDWLRRLRGGEALARAGINIDLISTSEIRISVLIKDSELDKAVAALHEAFELGGDEEAVVYAGTGR